MLLTKHYYSRYTIVDLNPDAYAMIIQYLYNVDISLVNKVKVVETLCKMYLLHTIIFLNKTHGRYGNVKIETRKILMEKIRYAKVVLQNFLVNGIDVKDDMVCKYHIQSCLELLV